MPTDNDTPAPKSATHDLSPAEYRAIIEGLLRFTDIGDAALAEGEPGAAMTYTVISSVLSDNKILEAADPSYRNKFAQMAPDERAKNLDADWNAKKDLRGLLRGLLDRVVDKPIGTIVARARGWDMAGTEPHQDNNAPDFTAGAMVLQDDLGNRYFAGLAICRKEPPGVLALMRSTATLDGPTVTQAVYKDPAQAGKGYALFVEKHLRKSSRCGPVMMLPCGSKVDQKVLNASPVAEDIAQGRMYILAGPWLEAAYDDGGTAPDTIMGLIRWMLGSFPSEEASDKDDICDGLSAARVALEQDAVPLRPLPDAGHPATAEAAQQLQLRPPCQAGRRGLPMSAPTETPGAHRFREAMLERMADLAVQAAKAQGKAVAAMMLDDFGDAAAHFERAGRLCRLWCEAKAALLTAASEFEFEASP